jgi:hypothetical protein
MAKRKSNSLRGKTKPLTETFAEVIVPLLANHGGMDTQTLYDLLIQHRPDLCTDRGQQRPWSVWQRDARNGLRSLKDKGLVELVPTLGYERKGMYRLVDQPNVT